MKTLLAVLLATILGVAVGAATAWWQIAACPWDRAMGPAPTTGAGPTVVIDQEEFDFGTMDVSVEGTHDFVVTNIGDAPLELDRAESSCGCTKARLSDSLIGPGQSEIVTLKWEADGQVGPFRQTVSIETNDRTRRRIHLVISGTFSSQVELYPTSVVFGEVPLGQPAVAEVRLLSYLDSPPKLTGYETANRDTSQYYEVTFEPLVADQLKEATSQDGVSRGQGGLGDFGGLGEAGRPTAGYLVKITLKPGLPQGTFRQKILLHTNQTVAPTVEIPVAGSVVGDISIVGPGWDDEHGVLDFDTVKSQEGAQRRLFLVTRGPHSQNVKFTLLRKSPNWLEVDDVALGETNVVGTGTITQTPLTIRIPKDAPRASFLGPDFGEILVGTTHPEVPQLRLRVRFAVEG